MRRIVDALQTIAATLWVGGLWITGYAVAPTLFSALPDRMLAGLVAGKLFTLMTFIGLACAAVVLVLQVLRVRGGALREPVVWAVLLTLGFVLAGEFGVQPVMAELKAQALPTPVMESLLRDRFVWWHGVASVLYLSATLTGTALIVMINKKIS